MGKKRNKSRKPTNKGTFFFAYQSASKSNNCDNVDAIRSLAKHLGHKATIWENMKISGRIINKQILSEIQKAETFACDLTYLNANVFFELGYAIGKRKPLFLMLNSKIKEARSNYEEISILKGIGYTSFNNGEDLKKSILEFEAKHILLNELNILSNKDTTNKVDIFYIKSSANSQAELEMINFISESDYTNIIYDKSEIAYQSLEWYLDSLNRCKNLIVHLSSIEKTGAALDTCINSLYAGLGYALEKKVVLVAPEPYFAPIDYNDILIKYDSADECIRRIKNWLPVKKKKKVKITEEDKELNLLKLGIGYSKAEDEKKALISYFVKTYAYSAALKNRQTIFYGRKGTGKTALFIMLNNHFSQEKNTYLLDLKPESTDLLENIEIVKLFNGTINYKNIFHTIWKFVLYSKLLLTISDKIKNYKRYELNEDEQSVIDYISLKKEMLELNFLGVIKRLYEESKSEDNPLLSVIEDYNKKFLGPMKRIIKDYLSTTKYFKIAIIADNLDKAWESNSDLSLQSEMILSLLEVSGKINKELYDKKNEKIDSSLIVFLRSDIYKFVLEKSREPDKLTIISSKIEWKSCRPLLKQVLENRIQHMLKIEKDDIPSIWKEYFDFGRENPFKKVESVCLPRPRDIIFFFDKMFESTCNNSRTKVSLADFEYALNIYTTFLYQNLVAEMSAEYPYIRKMINELHLRFSGLIEINKFRKIVKTYEPDNDKRKGLLKELFANEYLFAVCQKQCESYSDYETVTSIEESEKIIRGFMKKRVIHIGQHPKYARSK